MNIKSFYITFIIFEGLLLKQINKGKRESDLILYLETNIYDKVFALNLISHGHRKPWVRRKASQMFCCKFLSITVKQTRLFQ